MPLDLTGLPALTVPCGFSILGLPVGMQITFPPFRDDMAFRVGDAYERAIDWHTRQPKAVGVSSSGRT
ncbi:MAG: hypothetical protein ACREE5_00065 [Acetobacteraceae bacterium]